MTSISPAAARGLADLADRHARLERLDHRDAGDPVLAVAVEQVAVDVLPPGGLHVDVDVGQLVAVGVHEPLEHEVVRDGVDVGDPQRVGDDAARPPSRGRPP
jgi:hypothetical protein